MDSCSCSCKLDVCSNSGGQCCWLGEDAQPCSSCRNSLAKRCPCASDPRMLTGVRWQPGACSFMEPNGPLLCWDDEKLEGSLSARNLKFPVTSSPLLMAAFFYSKECFLSAAWPIPKPIYINIKACHWPSGLWIRSMASLSSSILLAHLHLRSWFLWSSLGQALSHWCAWA